MSPKTLTFPPSNKMVSIVIPSRNEIFLQKTVLDVLGKAKGDIEIIAVLDGYWPRVQKREFWSSPDTIEDPRITYVHLPKPRGMRNAINTGVAVAKGEFILKCDGHCMFDEGFDIKLAEECEENWVVIPRRYALDVEHWQIEKNPKYPVDYMYLNKDLHGDIWREKNNDPSLKNKLIDEVMSSQGSAWFMPKSYYEFLELEDEANYGTFANEFQEIGFKVWLSGGQVMVNKKTWYAHLHKNKNTGGRGYHLEDVEVLKAANYTKKWLKEKVWHKQTRNFEWMIEHFKPVPTW